MQIRLFRFAICPGGIGMNLVLTPKQTKAFKKDIIKAIKACKTSMSLNMVINLLYGAEETTYKTKQTSGEKE